jgi:hypothetical protein
LTDQAKLDATTSNAPSSRLLSPTNPNAVDAASYVAVFVMSPSPSTRSIAIWYGEEPMH